MLLELIVDNYAVVEHARVRFQRGLNILTGETGSGKSIVVDSLSLLLGARASAEMIRSGENKARVAGIFSIALSPGLRDTLAVAGIDLDGEDELIVEREIAAGGKSRAFVANRPVTTGVLRQLAPELGDIHGQNEQQLLFTSDRQRELVDEYAAADDVCARVSAAFSRWRQVTAKLAELSATEQEKLRLLDLWTFQRNEIDNVKPRAGEDGELENERKVLQNVTRLQESATAAFEALYESEVSATSQLRQTLRRVEDLTRIDQSLTDTVTSLKQSAILIEEAAYALRDYLGGLEADPKRLEDVESRLAKLDLLKRKYGSTLEDVLAFRDAVAAKVSEVENSAEHKAALEKELAAAAKEYETHARELSKQRATAARQLSIQVEQELKSLAMVGTQFQIQLREGPWTASGIDEVTFLVSPNKGEELKAMEKIASGGELSRIALAFKTAAQKNEQHEIPHTLVFDEVDAGVGGAAAAAIGRRLKKLSRNNQVICVTHLAQIAGFADHHYAVSKKEKKGRVATEIDELNREDRTREIGRMLSGDQVTPEALQHAEQLMQAGAKS
ncbi:MAG TPA: DNA repair protein RecN [Bryobacteraceae bacterium]|jgi:DNA repair protein RecN (Recombination protein N)|nr:DNA repair protein RecN [Bryobacteraceae bacterium]